MNPPPDPHQDPWNRFAQLTATPPPFVHERGRARLSEALVHADRRRKRRPLWIAMGLGLTAAATAAIVLVLAPLRPSDPAATDDDPSMVALDDSIPPDGTAPAEATERRLLATDEREIVELPADGWLALDPGTEATLHPMGQGARVELRRGAVTLDVQPGEDRRFVVQTGAWTVEALGTVFTVEATDEAPLVHVSEGRVRLDGPSVGSEGQLIEAEPLLIIDDDDDDTEPAEPTEVPATTSSGRPTATWIDQFRKALRRGDTASAAAALPAGFPTGSESIGATDYLDAADVLRGQGLTERAERAYRQVCKRRARSRACGAATVRRAIMAAGAKRHAEALELADDYLKRWPDGVLARDVQGRRMQWMIASGRKADARAVAEEYLRRWPEGSRASLARSILGR